MNSEPPRVQTKESLIGELLPFVECGGGVRGPNVIPTLAMRSHFNEPFDEVAVQSTRASPLL